MAFSPEIILLAFLLGPITGGGTPTDLVSLIEPADYFASRRLDAGAAHLLELASASPTDAKGGFQQLLAIRWLGENKDRLGEQREAVRRALGRLAEGPDGFARDYAQIALARIDGQPAPAPRAAPKDSLRDGLAWFPEDVSLAGVVDVRPSAGQRPAEDPQAQRQVRRVQAALLKAMPEEFREEMYRLAEAVGNWRLDREAVGFAPDPGSSSRGRIFMRGTGRFDHARLAAYLREKLGREVVVTEKKGLRGEPITILAVPNQPPALALIGDSDFLMAGYSVDRVDGVRLVEDMLAVRDGGRPSLLTGPLGKTLQDVPPNANGLGRGELPREAVASLARSSLGVAPRQVAVDLLVEKAGLDVRLRGTLDDESDARKLADELRGQVKEVVEALKALPVPVQLAGVMTVRKAVEETEVRTDGPVVTARATLSPAALKALLGLLEMALSSGPGRASHGG